MNRIDEYQLCNRLLDPAEPDLAYAEAMEVVRAMRPDFDCSLVERVFRDVQDLFSGKLPGYRAVATPYHDRRHTLQVFVCATRVAYGAHASGHRLTDDMIHAVLLGALLHDVGYAQRWDDEDGTGAKYTAVHVRRSIAFLEERQAAWGMDDRLAHAVRAAVLCTDHRICLSELTFGGEDEAMAGRILGTGDLVGQMADRQYLERLLFLYFEFQEAGIGDYQSMLDLLRKTANFYGIAKTRLDGDFEGVYRGLTAYFERFCGRKRNFYVESIEKNLAYLDRVLKESEETYMTMLRRGGIVEEVRRRLS